MNKALKLGILVSLGVHLAPVSATTYTATNDTFASVIASVQGGDTINMVGDFQLLTTQNYSFTSPVIVNASAATFYRTWTLRNIDNLSIVGGTFDFHPVDALYSAALEVYNSNNISVDHTLFTDDGGHDGANFSTSTNVSVTNSEFKNLSHSIGLRNVVGANLYNNLTVGTTIDGIDIAASQNVVASHNSCIQGAPAAGAHPDCIQIYSLAGSPLSSDITLSDNLAFGATQGFTKPLPAAQGQTSRSSATSSRRPIHRASPATTVSIAISATICWSRLPPRTISSISTSSVDRAIRRPVTSSRTLAASRSTAPRSARSGTTPASSRGAPVPSMQGSAWCRSRRSGHRCSPDLP